MFSVNLFAEGENYGKSSSFSAKIIKSAEIVKSEESEDFDNDVIAGKIAELIRQADSLRNAYDFSKSISLYASAAEMVTRADTVSPDSVLLAAILAQKTLSENGLSMTEFCSSPTVVAKQKFSLDEFFLFYPLKNHSWRPLPNQLDSSEVNSVVKALYFPDKSETVYFSAPDIEEGDSYARNIYRTELQDTVWTAPELVNEEITSASNEIYPILSPDGKSLYFASEGLYGMGGYDLYVTKWNEEKNDWGTPVNMGFPFSSPANDYLLMDTEEGKYTIFASDRGCSKDSVWIYVLEFDPMPVRSRISDPEQLRNLAELQPASDPARMDNESSLSSSLSQDENMSLYMNKMTEVSALRDSISKFTTLLEEKRHKLSIASGSESQKLKSEIMAMEMSMPELSDSLGRADEALRAIEMEFLIKGVVIDPVKIRAEADREVVGASSAYTFTKNQLGPSLNINILEPEKKFDYSFKILPEGQFAEDNTLPRGLVYQIQMFTVSRPAKISQLRGLSPVFKHRNPSGSITYSVGLFLNYKSVLANLNKVRSRGFRSAYISAYNDGKRVSIASARKIEKTNSTVYMLRIYPLEDGKLPELAVSAVSQQFGKDLVMATENGETYFMAGPFKSKAKLDELIATLKATGVTKIKVEEL